MMELVTPEEVEGIKCIEVIPGECEEILNKIVPEIIDLIKRVDKINKKSKCLGLAAPQVGIKKKFFVKYIWNGLYKTYFNGWYINNGSSRVMNKEGCYSYNVGRDYWTAKRWKSIIFFHDVFEEGKLIPHKTKFKGLDGFVIQHECDHLIGRTIFT